MTIQVFFSHRDKTPAFELDRFEGLCPFCALEGPQVAVRPGAIAYSELKPCLFRDDQGRYHDHDANNRSQTFTCTNGHNFEYRSFWRCHACQWTGGQTALILW